jgi:hypothetical protein
MLSVRWPSVRRSLEKCQTAQDDLRFAFEAVTEVQAQQNRDEYARLVDAQERTRELMIERVQARAQRSVTEEFRQCSRYVDNDRKR